MSMYGKKKKKHYNIVKYANVGSQETTGMTGKLGLRVQNEAGQKANRVLPREHTGHSKHLLPTTQEKTLHMVIN